MSKFDKAFAEVRLYLPLESESWDALQGTSIADLLTQSGKLAIYETQSNQKRKKGNQNNAPKK